MLNLSSYSPLSIAAMLLMLLAYPASGSATSGSDSHSVSQWPFPEHLLIVEDINKYLPRKCQATLKTRPLKMFIPLSETEGFINAWDSSKNKLQPYYYTRGESGSSISLTEIPVPDSAAPDAHILIESQGEPGYPQSAVVFSPSGDCLPKAALVDFPDSVSSRFLEGCQTLYQDDYPCLKEIKSRRILGAANSFFIDEPSPTLILHDTDSDTPPRHQYLATRTPSFTPYVIMPRCEDPVSCPHETASMNLTAPLTETTQLITTGTFGLIKLTGNPYERPLSRPATVYNNIYANQLDQWLMIVNGFSHSVIIPEDNQQSMYFSGQYGHKFISYQMSQLNCLGKISTWNEELPPFNDCQYLVADNLTENNLIYEYAEIYSGFGSSSPEWVISDIRGPRSHNILMTDLNTKRSTLIQDLYPDIAPYIPESGYLVLHDVTTRGVYYNSEADKVELKYLISFTARNAQNQPEPPVLLILQHSDCAHPPPFKEQNDTAVIVDTVVGTVTATGMVAITVGIAICAYKHYRKSKYMSL